MTWELYGGVFVGTENEQLPIRSNDASMALPSSTLSSGRQSKGKEREEYWGDANSSSSHMGEIDMCEEQGDAEPIMFGQGSAGDATRC